VSGGHLTPFRALALAGAAVAAACAGPGPAVKPAAPAAAGDPGLLSVRVARAGDPWTDLATSLQARRLLDAEGEADALLSAAGNDPAGAAGLVALRRLAELAEESPARSAQVDAGLARLLEGGRLSGLAAYRARVARALAAEASGELAAAARHRGENGAVTAWTLAGPFSDLRVLDFDQPIPPEQGAVPAEVAAPAGLPPSPTRTIAAPDGTLVLVGEPQRGDVYALVADAALAKGGAYVLAVNTSATVRVLLDGQPVWERRADRAFLPSATALPLELAAGRHRLTVKLARTDGAGRLSISLARADGAPSDAAWTAPAPGSPPPPAARPFETRPLAGARALAADLAPRAGAVAARVLAARDALESDRETAKALLAEALALAPRSATVLVSVARARSGDATLDARIGQTRAEAALRDALRADPGHAEARVLLARLLVGTERLDDAEEVLAGLVAPAAGRPGALAARARTAAARGLSERAEALAAEASGAGGSCEAAQVARSLAERRQALARIDETTRLLTRCRGGRDLLARHLRERGDLAGAAAAIDGLLAARPWDVEAGLARAELLVAQGQPRAAAERLGALAALWPRDARLETARAGYLELAGDRAGARAARERALLLDGGDLALRRALALEDGKEALDDLAFDPRETIRAYEAAGKRSGTTAVMVLDAAAIDIHPGGVATERTQQVIHVLDQAGVDEHGEVSPPSGAEIIALRTLKPDGRALEPDRTTDEKGAISLAGLEPGDYVLVDYIRAVRAPFAAQGYAADPFYFQVVGERLFRSTYVVRAPAGAGLTADAHAMPAPEVVRQGGHELVRGEQRDVPPYVPEPDAPSMGEYLPYLAVGTGASREAFQRNIADRLAGKTLATQEIAAFAQQIRAEAKDASPMALARAAYAKVARTILGEGPLLDEASEALSRGRGNRLVVLRAVLEALGLEVRVALVRPFNADPSFHRFPTPSVYPAQVLRVRAGGEVVWLDPSTRLNPFGALPGWLAGCEALILPAPGERPSEDRTPEAAARGDGKAVELRVVLAPDGGAELEGADRYDGTLGAMLKAQLEPLDASQRRQALESLLARAFRGLTVTALSFEGEDDPAAPLVIRWKGRTASLARPEAGGLVLEAALLPAELGPRYVRLAARTTPLLVQMAERGSSRIELVAPPGMRITAAPPIRLAGPFGTFERTERATDRGLVREERLEIPRARIPPAQYRDFATFVARIDEVQDAPVRVTR